MKESTTLLVLMLATIATGVIAVVAEENPDPTTPIASADTTRVEARQARRTALFDLYDVNHDGALDHVERTVLRGDVRSGRFPADLVGMRLRLHERRRGAPPTGHASPGSV